MSLKQVRAGKKKKCIQKKTVFFNIGNYQAKWGVIMIGSPKVHISISSHKHESFLEMFQLL